MSRTSGMRVLQVESLLNQLSEVNTRYCEVRPAVDVAEARARELEMELEAVKTELNEQKTLLSEQEERNKQMYLKMYAKGQEAARIEQADQVRDRDERERFIRELEAANVKWMLFVADTCAGAPITA